VSDVNIIETKTYAYKHLVKRVLNHGQKQDDVIVCPHTSSPMQRPHPLDPEHLLGSHLELHLSDGHSRVESLGASSRALRAYQ
jgi:hypothetical protein